MDKISVIVPVYNAEKYLKKCIDSVLFQTYKNIELILVNDGSKDGSLSILKEYEKKYPKVIKVFDQENQGAGMARNFGISKAIGKYLTFLDSDDWYKEDYLDRLHKDIKDNDIVISGFERYSSDYTFQYSNIPINHEWSKYKYCSVAGKMYRMDFIRKNKLKYKKFTIAEDCYFSIDAYSKTNKIVVSEYAGYCNYENLSSVTNQKSYNPDNSFIYVLKAIDKEINVLNLNHRMITFYYLKTLVVDIILHKDYLDSRSLTSEFREDMNWYKSSLEKFDLKFGCRIQNGERFKVNLVVNVFVVCYRLGLFSLFMKFLKKLRVKMI